MFRTLLFLTCAVRANFWDIDDTPRNSRNGWLENLRRRLMIDNDDYQLSSGNFEPRAMDKDPSDEGMNTTDSTNTADDLDTQQNNIPQHNQMLVYDSAETRIDENVAFDDLTTVHSMYMFHHQTDEGVTPSVPQNSIDENDDVYGISRNDVHVYIRDSEKQDPQVPVSTPKNVSYKIIQPSLLSRRAGDAVPRFVEEVRADGVSLLSVDGAPFPEFQLPSARRQYQAVKDSFSEDWLD